MQYDIVIIGGGPAGLSAAIAAKREGAEKVLILERDGVLGGILNQCIHNGFGLHTFKEELSGPEYAARYIEEAIRVGVEYKLNSTVIGIGVGRKVSYISETEGLVKLQAKAIVLAMGCRERPRGALNIPGCRPAGVYSAGTAQRLMNIDGYHVGKEVVILGSGDIGLIMARRMTLEGAKVKLVAELMPYSGGLKRNIVQCLNDYSIPLKLSHTVVKIHGKERVEGVTIACVDDRKRPIPGTEEFYRCDTLLPSVGLLPENELTRGMDAQMCRATNGPVVNDRLETSVEGIFACGNVLHVHDLVDFVSEESAMAGRNAAMYIREQADAERIEIPIRTEGGVRYTVPQSINLERMDEKITLRFRVADVYKNCSICAYCGEKRIAKKKKQIVVPGEMEQLVLEKESLNGCKPFSEIRICLEVDA